MKVAAISVSKFCNGLHTANSNELTKLSVMQERDSLIVSLLSHLDSWIGDTVARDAQLKCPTYAPIVAKGGHDLTLAMLRSHIGDAGKIKILRRFLASMLPTEDDQADSEQPFLSLYLLMGKD